MYKEEKRRNTYTKKSTQIRRWQLLATSHQCQKSHAQHHSHPQLTDRKACSTAAQSLSHAEYAFRNREPHLTLKPTAEKTREEDSRKTAHTHNSIRRGDGISDKGLRSRKDHIEQTLQASTAVEDASVSLHRKRPDTPETMQLAKPNLWNGGSPPLCHTYIS